MTEELKIEQTDNLNAQAAEAGMDTGAKKDAVSYGKFKDADALYSAYNSLQAEFTRRCQRLKELEERDKKTAARGDMCAEFGGKTKETAAAESFVGNPTGNAAGNSAENVAEKSMSEESTEAEKKVKNEENSENKISENKNAFAVGATLAPEAKKGEETPARVISEKEKEDVLKEYLEGILTKKTGAILMEGAGASLKTPRSRPKTVEEAGRLFRDSFGNIH